MKCKRERWNCITHLGYMLHFIWALKRSRLQTIQQERVTHVAAEEAEFLFFAAEPGHKLNAAAAAHRPTLKQAIAALRRQFPDATEDDVRLALLTSRDGHLGRARLKLQQHFLKCVATQYESEGGLTGTDYDKAGTAATEFMESVSKQVNGLKFASPSSDSPVDAPLHVAHMQLEKLAEMDACVASSLAIQHADKAVECNLSDHQGQPASTMHEVDGHNIDDLKRQALKCMHMHARTHAHTLACRCKRWMHWLPKRKALLTRWRKH